MEAEKELISEAPRRPRTPSPAARAKKAQADAKRRAAATARAQRKREADARRRQAEQKRAAKKREVEANKRKREAAARQRKAEAARRKQQAEAKRRAAARVRAQKQQERERKARAREQAKKIREQNAARKRSEREQKARQRESAKRQKAQAAAARKASGARTAKQRAGDHKRKGKRPGSTRVKKSGPTVVDAMAGQAVAAVTGATYRKRVGRPGARLNFSYSPTSGAGVSATVGTSNKKGLGVNYNTKRGVTVAARGTGLRWELGGQVQGRSSGIGATGIKPPKLPNYSKKPGGPKKPPKSPAKPPTPKPSQRAPSTYQSPSTPDTSAAKWGAKTSSTSPVTGAQKWGAKTTPARPQTSAQKWGARPGTVSTNSQDSRIQKAEDLRAKRAELLKKTAEIKKAAEAKEAREKKAAEIKAARDQKAAELKAQRAEKKKKAAEAKAERERALEVRAKLKADQARQKAAQAKAEKEKDKTRKLRADILRHDRAQKRRSPEADKKEVEDAVKQFYADAGQSVPATPPSRSFLRKIASAGGDKTFKPTAKKPTPSAKKPESLKAPELRAPRRGLDGKKPLVNPPPELRRTSSDSNPPELKARRGSYFSGIGDKPTPKRNYIGPSPEESLLKRKEEIQKKIDKLNSGNIVIGKGARIKSLETQLKDIDKELAKL